jgi:hypothetical protein
LPGITFPNGSIKGYIYVDIPGNGNNTPHVKLTATPSAGVPETIIDGPLNSAAAPKLADGQTFTEADITQSSRTGDDKGSFDLTGALNPSLTNVVAMDYDVSIATLQLVKDDMYSTETISAVLLIKLPLSLILPGTLLSYNEAGTGPNTTTYTAISDGSGINNADYIRFEMDDLNFSEMFGDKDLLQREAGDDKVFDILEIKKVTLILSKYRNSLLKGAYLAIKSSQNAAEGTFIDLSGKDGQDISIPLNVDNPFIPVIDILFKRNGTAPVGSKGYAIFSLGTGGEFNFGLSVDAEASVETDMTF